MLIKARKTVYLKVTRKSAHLPWPNICTFNDGNGIHVNRYRVTVSRNERLYQFAPCYTGYFFISTPGQEQPAPPFYHLTHLQGFPETLAKAVFRNKTTKKTLF